MSDLRFNGRLLPGADARGARLHLTALFRLRDPAAVERFFSGRAVTLRRNLPAAEAESLCARLRAAGLDCSVSPAPAASPAPEPEPEPEPQPGVRPPADAAGAPNPFQLRADEEEIVDAETAQLRWLAAAIAAAVLGACLLVTVTGALRRAPPPAVPKPLASAVDPAGQLYLLTARDLLIHDRGGIGLATVPARELGLAALEGPLLAPGDGVVILQGRSAEDEPVSGWRCNLDGRRCEPLLPAPAAPLLALADAGRYPGVHALTADALLWIDDGAIRARSALQVTTAAPRLIDDGGLLVANVDAGPFLAVFRPDPGAFGEQLDAPLLLAPGAPADRAPAVRDIARVGDRWWLLAGASGEPPVLHAFDRDWGFLGTAALPEGGDPQRLQPWGSRLLLLDPGRAALARLDERGAPGAPFTSSLLEDQRRERERAARWQRRGWGTAAALAALALGAALLALLLARDDRWRAGREPQPPAPGLERELRRFRWLLPRTGVRRQRAREATAVAALLGLGAVAAGLGAAPATALLLLAAACGVAGLALAAALPPGHIGLRGDRIALVDHRGRYQVGTPAQVAQRDHFLFCGAVAVHRGSRWLPAFPEGSFPRGAAGPRASRTVAAAALLRARHPLALGLAAAFPCLLAALAIAVI